MPRKESITIEMLLSTAFELARQEGIENVTARKLTHKIGCSTQPIFRVYENMEHLYADLFVRVSLFFQNYYDNYEKSEKIPFVTLGLSYIEFAQSEPNLFKLLFLSKDRGEKSMYELLNGESNAVTNEIALAKQIGCDNPSELFMKMWIFIHGAACMSITGDYDLTNEETKDLLIASYQSFSKQVL